MYFKALSIFSFFLLVSGSFNHVQAIGGPAVANTGWQELSYEGDLPDFEDRKFGPYECRYMPGKADVVARVLRTVRLGDDDNEISKKLCAGSCPDGQTPKPVGFVYKTLSENPVLSVRVIPPNDKGYCYYQVSKRSDGKVAFRAMDHSGDDLCKCF